MVLTTSTRVARVLGAVRLGVFLAVVAALGHDAVFAARYGLGRELASALRRSGHDGWWGPLVLSVATFAGLVLAVQVVRVLALSRRTARCRPRRRLPPAPSYSREWLRLWAILLPAASAIFVVQEELEHQAVGAAGHGLGTLVGPEHPLAIPVLTLVAGAVAAVAALLRWRIRALERILATGRWSTSSRRPIPIAPRPAVPSTIRRPLLGTLGLAFDPGRAPPAAC